MNEPINIEAMLDEFRARWSKQRQWGLKQDLSLPPLDGGQRLAARDAAHKFYWAGHFVVHGDCEKLLRATCDAIEAAHIARRAGRGRAAVGELLRIGAKAIRQTKGFSDEER